MYWGILHTASLYAITIYGHSFDIMHVYILNLANGLIFTNVKLQHSLHVMICLQYP